MAIPRPTVRGDSMSYYDSLGNLIHVPLDSPEWERWTAAHRSFRYDDPQGGFTARKEARHGYFYRRLQKQQMPVRVNPSALALGLADPTPLCFGENVVAGERSFALKN